MKPFITFIKKEFLHILRDKRTLLILVGMPVVQIIMFGFAVSTEVKDVKTAVLASSADVETRRLVDCLDASEYFTVSHVVHTPEEVNELFRKSKIELAVVCADKWNRRRYGSEQLQLIADATDPNLAVTRSAYAEGVLASAFAEIRQTDQATGGTMEYGNTMEADRLDAVVISNRLLYNPQMRSSYNFVPGVMGLILMMICAMMTSVSIVREKEMGTMEVLLVSPVHPFLMVISKTIPYLFLSLVNLTTILLLSIYVMDVPVAGNLVSLLGVSLLFIFVSLAFGLFVSCITQTQVAALLISAMGLMIPTMLLSGLIFPVESMPGILQAVSCLIPARWYIDMVRKLMIEGVPFMYVWHEATVLLVMAIVFTGLTVMKFKNKLE